MAGKSKTIDFDERPKTEEGRTLVRRIRMHEFLMSGGVQTGLDKFGKMTYSGPITVTDYPVCPWHDEHCEAWTEISEGRGEWTRLESELAHLEDLYAEMTREADDPDDATELEAVSFEIDKLKAKLKDRPRGVRELRERTDEQLAAERAAHIVAENPTVYAPAPRHEGNPWDKPSHAGQTQARSSYKPRKPLVPDSRDVAVGAFTEENAPDEIIIDGDEGEEGEE